MFHFYAQELFIWSYICFLHYRDTINQSNESYIKNWYMLQIMSCAFVYIHI